MLKLLCLNYLVAGIEHCLEWLNNFEVQMYVYYNNFWSDRIFKLLHENMNIE